MGLNYKKVIKQITKDFKDIKFVFVKHGDQYCCANGEDYYINNSFYMPFYKEIQVGIYSNQELKVIGMLHQIGHYIQSNNEYDNIFMKQLGAWKEAYKLIKQYNIQITDEMIEYFINCLNSYNKEQYNNK